jgi:hypothetical protein
MTDNHTVHWFFKYFQIAEQAALLFFGKKKSPPRYRNQVQIVSKVLDAIQTPALAEGQPVEFQSLEENCCWKLRPYRILIIVVDD